MNNNVISYLPVIFLLLLKVYTFCPVQGLPSHLRKLFYPLFLEELKRTKKQNNIKKSYTKMVKITLHTCGSQAHIANKGIQ